MGHFETIASDIIKFLKGIFPGGGLSVLLFVLTVNPLSFILRDIKGYSYRTEERTNDMTNIFFVDDPKLYTSYINILRKQLDLVTTFSEDTRIQIGVGNCE